MTQEQIDKVYEDLAAYEKEVADHNANLIESLGEKAQQEFEDLIEGCYVTEKITFVDEGKGSIVYEDYDAYKDVRVEQWVTNMEGDSYAGFIYAKVNDKWIKIPYSC